MVFLDHLNYAGLDIEWLDNKCALMKRPKFVINRQQLFSLFTEDSRAPNRSTMKILLIDHHELFRNGLRYVLQKLPTGMGELLETGEWQTGLSLVEENPDLNLVLLELKSSGCKGVESVKLFRAKYPDTPLVVLSGEEDSRVVNKVLDYGARGFVGKSVPETTLLTALEVVLAGDIYVPPHLLQYRSGANEYGLTKRQIQILECLAEGLSNKKISARFRLAEGTVKVHVAAVYQILRVRSRLEAVEVARKMGISAKNLNDHDQN